MARTLSSQAVFHQLTGVYRLDDSGTTGAVETGVAKGQLTFDLGTGEGASFAAGDRIRIGSNGSTAEVNEIASLATDAVTLKLPLSRAIVAAEVVTKLTAVDLGATDENGVNLETTQGETPIVAGTQKKTYLYINQNIEESLSFALRDFDKENLAASMGMDDTDTDIVGTNGVVLVLDDAVALSYQPWCFEGLLEGGTAVTAFVMSAKVASVNQTMQFVEGQATIIPFTLKSNGNRSFLFE
jgi:hypothetical protein